jgi:acyl dehydratase
MMHDSFLCHETTLGSPGHEKMLWPKPVRPGDHLTGLLEIKESKVSVSKPDLGFVRYTSTLKNQNQEDVFITTSTMIVKPRPVKTQ